VGRVKFLRFGSPKRVFLELLALLRREWATLLLISLGSGVVAFGIMALTLPYRFPDSGVTGLAVLGTYVWNISPAWIVAVVNVGLLIWGWRELSPRFVGWTAYGVLLLTVLLKVFDGFPVPHFEDRLLVAILAGVVKGLGGGIVFRAGGSLGGTDVIVTALRKRYGVEVGMFTFYINIGILALSSFIVGIEGAVFGLVSVYTNGLVMDNVLRSFDRRRQVFVITNIPDEVSRFVLHELHRGVTRLEGRGGFSGQPRPVLLCVLSPRQTMELKRFLAEHDHRSFTIVSDASEVVGRGFKSWKGL
jgi:uncharacterized membrane-anchored protein YitT (DUF2179 family)